jgi:hypothetical protein
MTKTIALLTVLSVAVGTAACAGPPSTIAGDARATRIQQTGALTPSN